ncbi:MAG: F0F1 ATP synthase subunit B [Rhodospirillaceae bacterium]|nr:F0F1 ATP synthase subunit B [Rhodospirillaceae bacterium]
MDGWQVAQADTAAETEHGTEAGTEHGTEAGTEQGTEGATAADAPAHADTAPAGGEDGLIAEVEHDLDQHGGEHAEPFLGPELLLAGALIVLIALLWKPAKRAIIGGLDSRAERIRNELEEAHRLREEAQAALATFQRKQRDAMDEARQIIEHARQDAERLRARAEVALEEQLQRREQQAMDRIAQAERQAMAEVRGAAVDVAITAAGNLIAQQMDEAQAAALVDQAIADLPKRIH